MRRHLEHVDRQLDVHVALDAAPAHRVGELLGRLGDHRVAVVIEPIDQRPDRRVFLVLEQRSVVERPDQPSLRAEKVEQPLVIYVELQAASGRIEVGAVNEYRNTFFWIEEHGYSGEIEISRYCHVREISRQARRDAGPGPVILIGIGSNLAAAGFASPLDTAAASVARFSSVGIAVLRRSRWYTSQPVPPSDQPWYVNGVAAVETALAPIALLDALLALEAGFGRRRSVPNAARTLDLDLLDYDGTRCIGERLVLPHPRLHERRFVLAPLAEIAPQWRHPRLGKTAAELLAALPRGEQPVRALARCGGRSGLLVAPPHWFRRAIGFYRAHGEFIVIDPADRYKAAPARCATACEASSR